MVQSIIIGLLLIISLFYLGRLVFRAFQGKTHCETGCGKCAEVKTTAGKLSL